MPELGVNLTPLGVRGSGAPLASRHATSRHRPIATCSRRSGLSAPVGGGGGGLGSIPVGGRGRGDIRLHRRLASSGLLLGLSLDLLGIAVEKEIDHDVPRLRAMNSATEAENLTSEEPVEQADGVLALIVGRDGHINVFERRVSVAKGDGWDVGVCRLGNGLVIGSRVGHEEEARLHEFVGDLVGEGTWSETSSNWCGTSVLAVLEDGALPVGASRDDADVGGILNRHDDARSKHQLVVGSAEVDNVDAVGLPLPHVPRHLIVEVLSAEVSGAGEHHLKVLLFLLLRDVVHRRHGSCGVAERAGRRDRGARGE
mmetsp:Transcript_20588/g.62795  ORF Transcript_20588/g.62795 Transcript_20588/m.62795 type:complete len:313 (+) Transcript_20588:298-1236(+)